MEITIKSFEKKSAFKGWQEYQIVADDGKIYEWWTKEGNKFPWMNGDTIEFELEEKEDKNGNIHLKVKKGRKKGEVKVTSSYNDPKVVKRMAKSICVSLAIKFFDIKDKEDITAETVIKAAESLYDWVMDVETPDRDIVSRRWYAVEHSLEFCKLTGRINEKDAVKTYAEQFLQEVNNV